jgi:hypothetical protein
MPAGRRIGIGKGMQRLKPMNMKKWSWLIVLLALLMAGPAFAGERPIKSKAKDFSVEIQMKKDPPVIGTNLIEIDVTDDDGRAVKDARVMVSAFMPARPGTQVTQTAAAAKWEGGKYKAKIDLPVGGTWEMSVLITQGGKTTAAKWEIDVW